MGTPNEVDQIKNLAVEQGVEITDDDLDGIFIDFLIMETDFLQTILYFS